MFFQPEGPQSWVSEASLTLSRTWRSPWGYLGLSGGGSATRYGQLGEPSQFSYTGNASGSFRLSSRTNLDLAPSFSSSYTRDLPPDAGLLLPLTVVRRLAGQLGLSHRLSAATSLSLAARYGDVRFDSGQFQSGSNLEASLSLGRRLGSRTSLAVSPSVSRSRRRDSEVAVPYLSGGWSIQLRPTVSVNASVGVGRIPPGGGQKAQWTARGEADVSVRKRRTGLVLRYQHGFSLAYGLGRERIADLASLGLTRRLGRRLGTSVSYNYGHSRDAFDPSFRFQTHSAVANVSWSLTRSLGLGSGYSYYRSVGAPSSQPVSNQRVGVSLLFSRQW